MVQYILLYLKAAKYVLLSFPNATFFDIKLFTRGVPSHKSCVLHPLGFGYYQPRPWTPCPISRKTPNSGCKRNKRAFWFEQLSEPATQTTATYYFPLEGQPWAKIQLKIWPHAHSKITVGWIYTGFKSIGYISQMLSKNRCRWPYNHYSTSFGQLPSRRWSSFEYERSACPCCRGISWARHSTR